ncbi:hypothetical protein ACFL6E_02470 [Candidatus Neomarinimicrobiota bacterium]
MRYTAYKVFLLTALPLIFGCAPPPLLPPIIYPQRVYPVLNYPFSATQAGVEIAAIPFAPGKDIFADPSDTNSTLKAGSLNLLDAGIQPIRLIIWNNSQDNIVIFANQIFGISETSHYFTYKPQDAVGLVVHSAGFKASLKGSRVGPVMRSVLGGRVPLSAAKGMSKGGMVGGTTGALSAILEPASAYERGLTRLITRVYTEHAFKEYKLYPGHLARGLIFLPSHSEIRKLQIVGFNIDKHKAVVLEIDFGTDLP